MKLAGEMKVKIRLCPRCFLQMAEEDVLNSLSHDGKTIVCSQCGHIESMSKLSPDSVYGLKLGQRRAQAAMWGLNKNRDPNLPKIEAGSQELWYDTETKVFELRNRNDKH